MLALFTAVSVKVTATFSFIPRHLPLAASIASITLLTACGGGSGGTTTSSTTAQSQSVSTSSISAPQGGGLLAAPRFAVAMDDLEVIGPFASWADAKRDYGAVGDGVADDTAALQRALNDLGLPGKASVLYLPAGNYKITSSLRLNWNAQIGGFGWGGVGIVGDSPSTTKITWAGAQNGAMLIQDGGYATRYARITWDGKGIAGYGIAHWWNALAGTRYDGSSEDVDEVFQDMAIGIMAGRMGAAYGQMNSEGVVRRVTFLRNTLAGLDTGSFNALDWWVFDSHFVDCARGVTNTFSFNDTSIVSGAGAFYVYRSVFERSTVADIHLGHTGWFSMHQNVSVGSRRFLQSDIIGYNPAPTIVKGNRIVETTDPAAIQVGNMGPLMLIDNQIRSAAIASTAAVVMNNFASGRDVLSIGNRYTVSNPVQMVDSTDRFVSIDDSTVARTAINATVPTLPTTPQRQGRQVFDVASGATTAQIQAAINSAAASGSTNAIVHMAPGIFDITSTLVVPAQARIQIAGDGLTTVLKWRGAANGSVIKLSGPSYATVRDLQIYTPNTSYAIVMRSANQTGGRIFIESSSPGPINASDLTQTQLGMQANPSIDSITLTNVQSFVAMATGVLGLVTSTDNTSALIADSWYEGSKSRLFNVNSGTFTYLGGHLTPYAATVQANDAAILLDGLNGKASFVGVQFDVNSLASGTAIQVNNETANTNALFLGLSSTKANYFKRTSSGGNVGVVMSKTVDGQGQATSLSNQGTSSPAFTTSMLAQARNLIWDTAAYSAPANATDVRIYHVMANQTLGMDISAAP